MTTPPSGDGSRSGVPTATGPAANILAVLRSGTAAQALTFIVFREQPTEAWRKELHARQVELDPDRLAPLEQIVNTIVIYIGVNRGVDLPPLGGHPLATTLGAIARHHLITLEVQLPVPAPFGACPDRHWARVRIGLRDTDISYLAPFLDTIRADTETHPDWDVRVQVVPERGPRAIAANRSAVPAGESHVVLASEMDIVASKDSNQSQGDHAYAHEWRVLALCANARGNIENDVVEWLRTEQPKLRLAAVTFAILHGTSVILVLGHQPEGHTDEAASLTGLEKACARARLQVLVDEWQSKAELGAVGPDPLLRVRIRSQDRPGALLHVLRSLDKTLGDELQLTPEGPQINVWHSLNQVLQGNVAQSRLTIRLPAQRDQLQLWDDAKFKAIERAVRQAAAREAAAACSSADAFSDGLGAPADPVITVSLIRAPACTHTPVPGDRPAPLEEIPVR